MEREDSRALETIKEIVKDNEVEFSHYQSGSLYYDVTVGLKTYRFPVPITDTEEGKFLPRDKAIYFMRYIRKAIERGNFMLISEEFKYTIKCTDCSRTYQIIRSVPVSESDLAKGGLCLLCFEDYK